MQSTVADLIVQLVPMFLFVSLPFAIGAVYLAPKMGRSPWLWAILFLVPFVNLLIMYVFIFLVAGAVLDRLNLIDNRVRNVAPSS